MQKDLRREAPEDSEAVKGTDEAMREWLLGGEPFASICACNAALMVSGAAPGFHS